jgi:biotin carboxyl carrier protein
VSITYTLTIDDRSLQAEVRQEGETFFVRLEGTEHEVSMAAVDTAGLFSFLIDGRSYEVHARASNGGYELAVGDENLRLTVERGHRHAQARGRLEEPGAWTVRSPMAGVVTEVVVAAGDRVERGSVLLILEAMKMKNEMRATQDGVVDRVDVVAGQRVERSDPLVHGRAGVVD